MWREKCEHVFDLLQVLGSGGSECTVAEETNTAEDGQYLFRGLLVRPFPSPLLAFPFICIWIPVGQKEVSFL